MGAFARLIVLVVILNLARYFVGGPIEGFTIMEPMHRVMPQYPEIFDNEFSTADFTRSLFYNFAMWFVAATVFHLMQPALKGSVLVKSFVAYGLMCAFFISLAAIYMNHYAHPIKSFYVWSMIDALIVFSVVALANALAYPLIFSKRAN